MRSRNSATVPKQLVADAIASTKTRAFQWMVVVLFSLSSSGCDLTPQEVAFLLDGMVFNPSVLPKGARQVETLTDPESFRTLFVPEYEGGFEPQPGWSSALELYSAAPTTHPEQVQVKGERLYAVSRDRGLEIMGIPPSNRLTHLGNFDLNSVVIQLLPLEDHKVLSFQPTRDQGNQRPKDYYSPPSDLSIVVLDTQDPSKVRELSKTRIPGELRKTIKIGSRLYVVTENSRGPSCSECSFHYEFLVTSFDISNPAKLIKKDQFELSGASSKGFNATFLATDKRIFISGPELIDLGGLVDHDGSQIAAIDLQDPEGRLALDKSAPILLKGKIGQSWQLRAHNNALLALSTSNKTDNSSARQATLEIFPMHPHVHTSPVGSLSIPLGSNEEVDSIVYHEDRAYLQISGSTRRLITIDLSDNAAPKLGGELELDIRLQRLFFREDAILGLGSETGTRIGARLIDAGDLANPVLKQTLSLEGNLASIPQEPDALARRAKVLSTQSRIAIPYANFQEEIPSDERTCQRTRRISGVLLVDWQDDKIALHKNLRTPGEPLGILEHQGQLIVAQDQATTSFDLSSPSIETPASDIDYAISLTQWRSVTSGEKRLRVRSNGRVFDLVDKDQLFAPASPQALKLDLRKELGCRIAIKYINTFVHGRYAHAFFLIDPSDSRETQLYAVTLDLSSESPSVTSTNRFPMTRFYHMLTRDLDFIVFQTPQVVQDGALLFWAQRHRSSHSFSILPSRIEVFDLSGPQVRQLHSFERPDSRYAGALTKMGDHLVSSWYAVANDNADPDELTVYWQRFQVGPNHEVTLREFEVPGIPLALSPNQSVLASLGIKRRSIPMATAEQCHMSHGARAYSDENRRCTIIAQKLHSSLIVGSNAITVASEDFFPRAGMRPTLLASHEHISAQGATQGSSGRPNPPYGPSERPDNAAFVSPYLKTLDTLVWSIQDDGSLLKSQLPEQVHSRRTLSVTDPDHLLRSNGPGYPLEVFDLRQQPNPTRRVYLPRHDIACRSPRLDGDDLLCLRDPGLSRHRALESSSPYLACSA